MINSRMSMSMPFRARSPAKPKVKQARKRQTTASDKGKGRALGDDSAIVELEDDGIDENDEDGEYTLDDDEIAAQIPKTWGSRDRNSKVKTRAPVEIEEDDEDGHQPATEDAAMACLRELTELRDSVRGGFPRQAHERSARSKMSSLPTSSTVRSGRRRRAQSPQTRFYSFSPRNDRRRAARCPSCSKTLAWTTISSASTPRRFCRSPNAGKMAIRPSRSRRQQL